MIEMHKVLTYLSSLSSTRPVRVATPLALTMDSQLADPSSKQLQCHVEHHEAFGVALSCAPKHVPFATVLGVSDATDAIRRRPLVHASPDSRARGRESGHRMAADRRCGSTAW